MNFSRNAFRHIYIEEELLQDPGAKRILCQFPDAVIIPVRRYTDVFSRSNQNPMVQRQYPNLILARKHGTFLYEGAPVCHHFGHTRFYYTSSIINCLFDCEYCWLKGMYSTADIVLFLNLEDYFRETEQLLKDGPLYLSLSFETDMVPLESISHQIKDWNAFLLSHETLTAEIRTKSGSTALFSTLSPCSRLIFAFTLSPEELISASEHYTGTLEQRLNAVQAAIDAGFPVRICFDPLICFPGWQDACRRLVKTTAETIDLSRIQDFSVGTYRQSETYQRRMRRRWPNSPIIQYPYETRDGYCQYSKQQQEEMEQLMADLLSDYIDPARIFLLKEENIQ